MSRRRYLLMLLADSEKYQENVFAYVYHSLITSTREKGKMKLAEIDGNGVIENQLNDNGASTTTANGITLTNNGNGSFTISGTASAETTLALNTYANRLFTIVGHKYLLVAYGIKGQSGSNFDIRVNGIGRIDGSSNCVLSTCSTTENYVYLVVRNGYAFSTPLTIFVNLIDLTLMFGTGNEPTTLSDNRIQSLLNRGYIPYNQGEYKGTNVGEIATEPYNIWDEQWELGAYSTTSGSPYYAEYQIRAKDKLDILPNTSYKMTYSGLISNVSVWAGLLDENETIIDGSTWGSDFQLSTNFRKIGGTGITNSFITPANAKYLVFYLTTQYGTTYTNDICFHRTGTRTGYAKHKPSVSIPFIYQGNGALNAHDTFEITSSEYVFTRKVSSVDLGTLTWGKASVYGYFSSSLSSLAKKPTNNSIIPNIICSAYPTVERSNYLFSSTGNNVITIDADGDVDISTQHLSTENDFKLSVSGIYLHYELATPQVITIPKNHLGCVDLGTLTWEKKPNNWFYTSGLSTLIKPWTNYYQPANIYCSKYITVSGSVVEATSQDNVIAITGNTKAPGIYDSSKINMTATEFAQSMAGIYLFYETDQPVQDFTNKIKYENGGTITTYSFGWVENQQIDYANIPASRTGGNLTIAYDSSSNVIEINNTANANFIDVIQNKFSVIANHKYLFASELENLPTDVELAVYDTGTNYKTSSGYLIFTPTSSASGTGDLMLSGANGKTFTNCKVKNPRIVDLTLAFGSGNEPTSINDPRIQRIIAKGYIATNTTGTQTYEDNEVLPNLTMRVQI